MVIPDALDLFNAHDARQQAELDRLPKCEECGYPIQDEWCYRIDGELICEECVEKIIEYLRRILLNESISSL